MNTTQKRLNWLSKVTAGKSARDAELLTRASETLEKNICDGEEYPWYPLRGILPSAFTYKGIWNWDAAFHAMAVKYWDSALAYEQCRIFWKTQLDDGMFLDVWHASGERACDFTKPPVFPWSFEGIYRASPDREMLEKAYAAYSKNAGFWESKRERDGLFFYSSAVVPVNEAYAKCESGWDTSVRFDGGITNMWSVDLNCYAVMMYRSLAFMAGELGLEAERAQWTEKESALSLLICDRLWDSERSCFTDTYFENERRSAVLSPASFMPLYIGIASKEQAAGMMEIYKKHFYPLMPSVSYLDEKYEADNYWRGPCWINIAYFAIKGMAAYGYTEAAEEARDRILDTCCNEKRSIFEYYNSKTGEGLGAKQYGWSSAFIIEFILNF